MCFFVYLKLNTHPVFSERFFTNRLDTFEICVICNNLLHLQNKHMFDTYILRVVGRFLVLGVHEVSISMTAHGNGLLQLHQNHKVSDDRSQNLRSI